jgi:hypothetical protein
VTHFSYLSLFHSQFSSPPPTLVPLWLSCRVFPIPVVVLLRLGFQDLQTEPVSNSICQLKAHINNRRDSKTLTLLRD